MTIIYEVHQNFFPHGISLSELNLIKMLKCARPDCSEIGTKACSAYHKEYYCNGVCQKEDWKSHKIMCNLVKQMPDV
jgi:hypothetical protein